jgi:hypothetical protein
MVECPISAQGQIYLFTLCQRRFISLVVISLIASIQYEQLFGVLICSISNHEIVQMVWHVNVRNYELEEVEQPALHWAAARYKALASALHV